MLKTCSCTALHSIVITDCGFVCFAACLSRRPHLSEAHQPRLQATEDFTAALPPPPCGVRMLGSKPSATNRLRELLPPISTECSRPRAKMHAVHARTNLVMTASRLARLQRKKITDNVSCGDSRRSACGATWPAITRLFNKIRFLHSHVDATPFQPAA